MGDHGAEAVLSVGTPFQLFSVVILAWVVTSESVSSSVVHMCLYCHCGLLFSEILRTLFTFTLAHFTLPLNIL